MQFRIDPSVFDLAPELLIGVIVARGITNVGSVEMRTALLRDAEVSVRTQPDIEAVNDHPRIACWRELHKAFGSSPKNYPPSIASLVRRVVKGGQLPMINALVDIYNAASLRFLFPAGGEDIATMVGDLRLTRADGAEFFVEIGQTETEHPEAGEVIYVDDAGVICRRMNWREADRTKLTDTTTDAVIVFEMIPPATRDELDAALAFTAMHIQIICGGTIATHILSKDVPMIELV